MWLKASTCVTLSGLSRSTILAKCIPWGINRRRGSVPFKNLQLDEDARPVPRYFWPDLRAFLMGDEKLVAFVPLFHDPSQVYDAFHVQTEMEETNPLLMRIERAARYLDLCRASISARMVEWEDSPVAYRIRSTGTELKKGGEPIRLCYQPDLDALLKIPPPKFFPSYTSGFHVE